MKIDTETSIKQSFIKMFNANLVLVDGSVKYEIFDGNSLRARACFFHNWVVSNS